MSAVVEAIGDAVGGVVEAVGDAVEWVGDTVSNVVEAAMDDPVKAALQIGVMVATSGAGAAALGMSAPLTAMQAAGAMAGISGVSTLAEGGDIEDAMKSAATSFAVSQAVSFGMDAFGAANVPETVSGTTQFFDDGTSIQFFDDGSRIVTDAAGAINATPATDVTLPTILPEARAPEVVGPETLPAGVQPSGAETFPVPPQPTMDMQGLPDITQEILPEVTEIPQQLLEPSMAELTLAAQTPAFPQALPDELLAAEDLAIPAAQTISPQAAQVLPEQRPYQTIEDLLYDKGELSEQAYKELTGAAPIIDRSVAVDRVEMTPLSQGLKDVGLAGLEYAKANPFTTAGIAAAGLALTGALGGEEQAPGAATPTKKTYTYGEAPPISRTGLEATKSAAEGIYGPQTPVARAPQTFAPPVFESPFKPLLLGQATGAPQGLAALGAGPRLAPMGVPQTFDISNLTPEQIVRLQDQLARTRGGG